MVPFSAISFEPPGRDSSPTLFFSVSSDAVGFVCQFASGVGVLWLTGAEAGKPSMLDEHQREFFVPVQLEASVGAHLNEGSELPDMSVLKSAASTAVKSSSQTKAARYYTIAGPAFGEPSVFAAFSAWQAVVEANGSRHVLVRHGKEQRSEGAERNHL